MGSETLPSACYILSDESSIPFYSTSNGYKNVADDALLRKQMNNTLTSELDLSKQSNADQDTKYSAESSFFENVVQNS